MLTLFTRLRPLHGNFNPIRNIFRVAGQAARGKRERRHKTAGHRCSSTKRRMLRIVSATIRAGVERVIAPSVTNLSSYKSSFIVNSICTNSLTLNSSHFRGPAELNVCKNTTLLSAPLTQNLLQVTQQPTTNSTRSLTKFSLTKGKRKSVKAVIDRFYRLHWGVWIRTKAGRHSNLWRKSLNRKKRLGRHVFCNATQSWLLDKMVTRFWKRPKYYVDDPYEPYHSRENFSLTKKKPSP